MPATRLRLHRMAGPRPSAMARSPLPAPLSKAAQTHHQNGAMDQFHSNDFLLYASLQTAEDDRAKAVIGDSAAALTHFEAMPEMGERYMEGMFPYYRTKLPVFFALEMRDWKSAAALEPVAGARPETQPMPSWARTIAPG